MRNQTASGERRHVIGVENPSAAVPDGDGGFTQTWSPADPPTVYASIRATGPADLERPTSGTVTANASHLITIPYHAAITTQTRLTFGTRRFSVTGVTDVDERHVELQIMAEELVA